MEQNVLKKNSSIGAKLWTPIIIFGIVGQLAWVIENMYFANFAQNLFEDRVYGNAYYVATTLMVILSAITATVSTIFAGGLCDRTGKRKPFIAFGYIIWGVTIMLFAAIPIGFDSSKTAGIIAMLVIFDCIMTFFGSTANDAAFNTWLTDVTDTKNRGRINAVLSIMPVLAMVIAIVVAMFTFTKGFDRIDPKEGFLAGDPLMYKLFFIIMGVIPMIAGVLAIFTLKDAPNIVKDNNPNVLKETFYGFRKDVIKSNKMLYVTLATMCIIGISQQVFMSYLISFIEKTLGITDYFLPLGGVIVGAAVMTGVLGLFFDKVGKKHFYFPLMGIVVISTLLIFLMKYMGQSAYLPMLIVVGILLMGSLFSINAALMGSFQDYIPTGTEGRFQGVRMCFTVLIPMIIGPIIALIIGMNSFSAATEEARQKPDFMMFLAAAVVAVLAFIPLIFVYKDSDRLRAVALAKHEEELAAEKAAEESETDDVNISENGESVDDPIEPETEPVEKSAEGSPSNSSDAEDTENEPVTETEAEETETADKPEAEPEETPAEDGTSDEEETPAEDGTSDEEETPAEDENKD